MDYYDKLGKPDTDPLRIELRERHADWVKSIRARNTAIDGKADKTEIDELAARCEAARESYVELLHRVVARPYQRASNEPDPDPAEPMTEEDE